MSDNKEQKNKRVPVLGNRLCGVWLYVIVLLLNAGTHAYLFFLFGRDVQILPRLLLSFVFFIYPLCYLADVVWSLNPAVLRILSGRKAVNRKYYMNTVREEFDKDKLLPVTVSIPVYQESNEIIFKTFLDSISAGEKYKAFSGREFNVLVSDDGLAPLLGGNCSKEKAEEVVRRLAENDESLSPKERMAAERIVFYREHNISYVARPAKDRAGLFKKASNLNYTLKLCEKTEGKAAPDEFFLEGGAFEGGYAEGPIDIHEIILLLDKDSGLNQGIINAVLPEFTADDELAYVQCSTKTDNIKENYYSSATGHQTNNLFHIIWPCKALQGYFVPLVGHNVFMRKSMIYESGLWAENKVSEDYDMAIKLYGLGYHGKFAQLRDFEFTEATSRTFTEETDKQRRYAYGLFEMIFDGTISHKKARGCDIFYMLLYFCSAINQSLLIPTVLIENYFGNIHLLWAGFLFCMACFVLAPLLRNMILRRLYPEESEGIFHALLISLSFLGHSYSIFIGACRYIANKFKKITKAFPSTNVDQLDYRLRDGLKILWQFVKKNPLFLIIAFLCIDRGIYIVTRRGLELVTVITYGYILFGLVLVPILLTPQLFPWAGINSASKVQAREKRRKEREARKS